MITVCRRLAIILCIGLLSACAVEKGASVEAINRAAHVADDAPYVALVTMVNKRSGRAAHTALVINASQRVIYDPAGTFQHRDLVERGDIHYGATDRLVDYYKRYHARFSHYVHEQRVDVSPAVAEAFLRRAQAQGPSPKMLCNIHATSILNDVGAFGQFESSFFPEVLRKQFAQVPGVRNSYVDEEDQGKVVPTN